MTIQQKTQQTVNEQQMNQDWEGGIMEEKLEEE